MGDKASQEGIPHCLGVKKNTIQSKGIKMSIVECVTAVLPEKNTLERGGMQTV